MLKIRKKVSYVPQLVQTECGMCCVAMILRYYGNHESLNVLRDFFEVGRDGLSVKTLKDALITYGFESKIFKAPTEALKLLESPSIVFWDDVHYIVLEKIVNDNVYIVDPATGRKKLSLDEFNEKYSGIVLTADVTENFQRRKKEKNVWFNYAYIVLNNKSLLFKILIYSMLAYLFTIGYPLLTQKIIDSTSPLLESASLILGIATAILGYFFVMFINGRTQVMLQKNMYSDLSKNVYKHLMNLPYKFFETRSYGDLMFRLESLFMVKSLYGEKLVSFFIDIGAVLIIIGFLFVKSTNTCLLVIGLLVLIAFMLNYINKQILLKNSVEINELSKLQTIRAEMIYSMQNIKSCGIEDDIYKSWSKQFDTTADRTMKRDYSQNNYSVIINISRIAFPVIILFINLFMYKQGELTLGQVMAIYSITNSLFLFSINVFASINNFSLSSQYLERVKDITDQELEQNGNINIDDSFKGEIELKDVSFKYTKHSPTVLKDINININKGDKIAIVGLSGSGKSTLSKLMLGLYTPTEGSLYFDNINIKDINKKTLRSHIGVVPQENSLMNKTIFENITMSRGEFTLAEVKEACKIACIDDEIERMPMKYNTLISDMGMNLSGGQRQRILLARALLNKPSIILLDEATSSLDAINEKKISEYFSNNGCTRIIIAHRLSTIKDSDIIYVLDKGEIVEYGTHDELLLKKGYYYKLYSNQLNYKEIKAS